MRSLVMRKWSITDKRFFCPKCGDNVIVGKSKRVGEDVCEMWVECENCGYDPCDSMDHVESVWGWQKEYAHFAIQAWKDAMEKSQNTTASDKGE